MFSGKTESLVKKAKVLKEYYPQLKVVAYKPKIDDRYSKSEIASHNGNRMEAEVIEDPLMLLDGARKANVVMIDEIQFFNKKSQGEYVIVSVLEKLVKDGLLVIVAGLNRDFRGKAFQPMGEIMAISDDLTMHISDCVVCGGNATVPQRLINGEPAYFDDPIVMVGASNCYEPRCRACHQVNEGKRMKNVI